MPYRLAAAGDVLPYQRLLYVLCQVARCGNARKRIVTALDADGETPPRPGAVRALSKKPRLLEEMS